MVTIIISICLLITPFVIAFLHSSIIYNKHKVNIYANYFIVSNISLLYFINSYAYLLYGDNISKFQGWIFTPAIFQIGIFQLSLLIFSVIAIFKGSQIKAACLIFFSIYTILNSFTLFGGSVYYDYVEAIFFINITTALISYILYRKLESSDRKKVLL